MLLKDFFISATATNKSESMNLLLLDPIHKCINSLLFLHGSELTQLQNWMRPSYPLIISVLTVHVQCESTPPEIF